MEPIGCRSADVGVQSHAMNKPQLNACKFGRRALHGERCSTGLRKRPSVRPTAHRSCCTSLQGCRLPALTLRHLEAARTDALLAFWGARA